MALWIGLLIRWWGQRQSLLRFMLFMLGAGLTFNLGRDMTLLVLWPVVFVYSFVPLIETLTVKRFRAVPKPATRPPSFAPADAASGHLAGRLHDAASS
jgi:hypothetical protein